MAQKTITFKEVENIIFQTTLRNLPALLIDYGFVDIFDEKITKKAMAAKIKAKYFIDGETLVLSTLNPEPETKVNVADKVSFTVDEKEIQPIPENEKVEGVPIVSSENKVSKEESDEKAEDIEAKNSKDQISTDINVTAKDNPEIQKTGMSKKDLEKNIFNGELMLSSSSPSPLSQRAILAEKVRRWKAELLSLD